MGPPSPRAQHKINQWAARLIPAILIALVGFATWVVIVLIGVNYLLQPPNAIPRRRCAGIALIVIYSVLFLLVSASYLRVLQVVTTNPGLVPLPSDKSQPNRKRRRSDRSSSNGEKATLATRGSGSRTSQQVDFLDRSAISGGRQSAPAGLEQYYNHDVFECEIDGMPRWCSNCKTWKPDRSHHSSEIGRCVYKMDHFCPWAGGIISETTYKFFIQFCIYTMLYCTFTLVVSAYYVTQWHRFSNSYHVTWVIVIALAGLFWLFTLGMTYNSLLAVHHNTTTVDNLTRANRVYYFAILMPDWHPFVQHERQRRVASDFVGAMIGPLPPEAATAFSTITYPLLDASTQGRPQQQQARTFAVLPSPQGSNPYLLTSTLANWRSVFGHSWYDWLLPFKYSPCCDHASNGHRTRAAAEPGLLPPVMYEFGPVLEDMKREAGLLPHGERTLQTDRYGRRRIQERTSSNSHKQRSQQEETRQ